MNRKIIPTLKGEHRLMLSFLDRNARALFISSLKKKPR